MTAPNVAQYFTANATIVDVEQPNPAGSSIDPQILDVNAYVNFYPGSQTGVFPAGFAVPVQNFDPTGVGTAGTGVPVELPIAPITGRLMNGKLCSIVIGDPVGVGLLCSSAFLNLADPLFWHVQFQDVDFGGALQQLNNFAIAALTAPGSLDLFASTTTQFPYLGP
jgi:hypothetical protein